MNAKEKARRIILKYKFLRLDILTTMDSVPAVVSDYPTNLTAKILAQFEVRAILDAVTSIADKKYDYFKEVEKEIDNF